MADSTGPRLQDVIEDKRQKRIEYAREVINRDESAYQVLDDYYRGLQMYPFIPNWADAEMQELNKRSVTNLMRIAVKIPASLVFMDGCIRGTDSAPPEWVKGFVGSGFSARQNTLAVAALKYGQVIVGLENLGKKSPKPKIYSTKNTCAIFTDPVNDIIPLYVISILALPRDKDNPGSAIYMDKDVHVQYEINDQGDWKVKHEERHDLGETPAVRYFADLDDEGRVTGAIEPLIDFQDSVNQAKRNLLRNNNYSAEKVRVASGVVGEMIRDKDGQPVRDDQGNIKYAPLEWTGARAVSVAAPDAKFSTLDETPADGFISTMEELIREFAVAAQIPPHALLGNLSNLSAETLTAALGQTVRLVHGLQTSWGESHRSLLRLMAIDMGEIGPGEEYDSEPQWRDMTDRSFANVVDGLGKMAQMLGVPMKALWRWVPRVTGGELALWDEMKVEQDEEMRKQALDDPRDPAAAAARERRPRPGRSPVNVTGGTPGAGGVPPGSSS